MLGFAYPKGLSVDPRPHPLPEELARCLRATLQKRSILSQSSQSVDTVPEFRRGPDRIALAVIDPERIANRLEVIIQQECAVRAGEFQIA